MRIPLMLPREAQQDKPAAVVPPSTVKPSVANAVDFADSTSATTVPIGQHRQLQRDFDAYRTQTDEKIRALERQIGALTERIAVLEQSK